MTTKELLGIDQGTFTDFVATADAKSMPVRSSVSLANRLRLMPTSMR